jgi:hypothetical protein
MRDRAAVAQAQPPPHDRPGSGRAARWISAVALQLLLTVLLLEGGLRLARPYSPTLRALLYLKFVV